MLQARASIGGQKDWRFPFPCHRPLAEFPQPLRSLPRRQHRRHHLPSSRTFSPTASPRPSEASRRPRASRPAAAPTSRFASPSPPAPGTPSPSRPAGPATHEYPSPRAGPGAQSPPGRATAGPRSPPAWPSRCRLPRAWAAPRSGSGPSGPGPPRRRPGPWRPWGPGRRGAAFGPRSPGRAAARRRIGRSRSWRRRRRLVWDWGKGSATWHRREGERFQGLDPWRETVRDFEFGNWELRTWDEFGWYDMESIQCSVENIVLRILSALVRKIRNWTVTSDFMESAASEFSDCLCF